MNTPSLDTETQDYDRNRRLLWFTGHEWLNIFFMWLLFSCVEYLNPFGLSYALSDQSRDFLYRWIAPFHSQEWRDRITVLTVTDKHLDAYGEIWPAQYAFHAAVLRALLEEKPAAVFVDIGFIDARQDATLDEFLGVVSDYGRNRTPLLFASPDGLPTSLRRGLAEMVRDTPGTVDTVAAPSGRHELDGLIYPLWIKYPETEGAGRPTAAAALYRALHARYQNASGASPFSRLQPLDFDPQSPDMELQWALSMERHPFDPYQLQKPETEDSETKEPSARYVCGYPEESHLARLLRTVLEPPADAPDPRRSHCPFHTTLPVTRLLEGPPLGDENGPEYSLPVTDRVVIYAAQLTMIEDRVEPPPYHPINAAHYHAMALDNLLLYGDRYKRHEWEPFEERKSIPVSLLISIIALFPMMLVAEYSDRKLNRLPISASNPRLRIRTWIVGWSFVISAAVVFSLSYIAYARFDLGASNWAGLLTMMVFREEVEGRLILDYIRFLPRIALKWWLGIRNLQRILRRILAISLARLTQARSKKDPKSETEKSLPKQAPHSPIRTAIDQRPSTEEP